MEAAGSLVTGEPLPDRGVAVAVEVLSAPQEVAYGQRPGSPLRDSPAPVARPPPSRDSRAARGRWEPRAANCRTGQTGRTGGRKQGWDPEGDSGATLRMWPRRLLRPQVRPTSRLQLVGGRSPQLAIQKTEAWPCSFLLVAPIGKDRGGEC